MPLYHLRDVVQIRVVKILQRDRSTHAQIIARRIKGQGYGIDSIIREAAVRVWICIARITKGGLSNEILQCFDVLSLKLLRGLGGGREDGQLARIPHNGVS